MLNYQSNNRQVSLMQPIYEEFIFHLDKQDKQRCVAFVLDILSRQRIDIVTLYEQILAPSLRERFCHDKQEEICVWEEHVRTSTVRTIIECCFPYVVEERSKKYKSGAAGKAIILCPSEEYHEIGARMVADFFTLCGYDAVFVGANTPITDILGAIGCIKPEFMGISVSNSYNILTAQRLIKNILEIKAHANTKFKIVVGGCAFRQQPEIYLQIGADLMLDTFSDIKKLLTGAR